MRHQGKLINWKDNRGFGFVIPNGGGQKAFVHIKAFSNSDHRPNGGDIITYELATDQNGRFVAKDIRYAKGTTPSATSSNKPSFGTIFLILFLLTLVLSSLLGQLPISVISFYIITSVIAFIFYAIDKSAAKNDRWRTPENTLHLLALIGGWPGALVAQKSLRHKSRKKAFQTVFWFSAITNCFILGWLLLTKTGTVLLSSILS